MRTVSDALEVSRHDKVFPDCMPVKIPENVWALSRLDFNVL